MISILAFSFPVIAIEIVLSHSAPSPLLTFRLHLNSYLNISSTKFVQDGRFPGVHVTQYTENGSAQHVGILGPVGAHCARRDSVSDRQLVVTGVAVFTVVLIFIVIIFLLDSGLDQR